MDALLELHVLAQRIFLTSDDAALHALHGIAEQNYEVGGVILRDQGGRYTYTAPTGNRKTRTFELRLEIPPGQTLTGIYHTHPSDGTSDINNEYFSPNDVDAADRLKVPSYIKSLKSGNVRRYRPGLTPTHPHRGANSRAGGQGRFSKGELLRYATPRTQNDTPWRHRSFVEKNWRRRLQATGRNRRRRQ